MSFARLSGFMLVAAATAFAAPSAMAAASGPAPRVEIPRPAPQPGNQKQQAAASDFDKAEYLIKADKCEEAIPLLLRVVAENGRDADALNYLGFCHRKLGKYPEALEFYKRALSANPKHKGATEYLGELYLRMNDLERAEEQHTILKGLCPTGCEELEDLEADIADFKANGNKWPG